MSLEDIKRKRNEDATVRDKAIKAAADEINARKLKKIQDKKVTKTGGAAKKAEKAKPAKAEK